MAVIPRAEINQARTFGELVKLHQQYKRAGEADAVKFAEYVLRSRAARKSANREFIGFGRRKEAYRKGKEL